MIDWYSVSPFIREGEIYTVYNMIFWKQTYKAMRINIWFYIKCPPLYYAYVRID